ncbi:hypothetical protein BJ875DRAFT_486227 [Amylocarpus encephaloides]|uniref:Thiol methyltransferase n=1 Tax=Amylocarpus encephaloides TaxID=45428 RepID=A0A9P7YEN0_9HELO|nr:hypothetical protein BJ875DRAFT_486227 [Amylocarpus encephaloides]
MDAPLSSPSMNGPSQTHSSYFVKSASSSAASSTQASSSNGAAQTQSQQNQQYQPPQPARQSQQAQMQTADGTSPFLRDFNLVAEAAKRAQIACLMRDMEAVGI